MDRQRVMSILLIFTGVAVRHLKCVSLGNNPVLFLACGSSLTGRSMVVTSHGGTDPSVPFFRLTSPAPAPLAPCTVRECVSCVFAFDGVLLQCKESTPRHS